jgi:hypothetical protein
MVKPTALIFVAANPTGITGCAGACVCSPSASTVAAAPEPPPERSTESALDSVELAPPPARTLSGIAPASEERPEVAGFRQVQAILQEAEGETMTISLKRVIPYGERTRLAVGYILIWQAALEELEQKSQFTEKHYLQALDFADGDNVSRTEFYCTLRAAWKQRPQGGFDPLFHCTRHSKKFTLFLKHYRVMEDELIAADKV